MITYRNKFIPVCDIGQSVSFNKGDLFSGNQLYVSDVYHNNLFTYIIKFQAGYKLKMKILHLANISWVFICQALF